MNVKILVDWWQQNHLLLSLAQLGLTLLVLILLLIYKQSLKKYRLLLENIKSNNKETLLLDIHERIKANTEAITAVNENLKQLKKESEGYLQHWALIRFKAFDNIGGDQSFALALMDACGNGLVISSIYGREQSVVYSKPLKNGNSIYPLSQEEKEAINQAWVREKK
ncbi:MAG TPA: DUF4446 family protein [Bacillota bacterium]